MSRKKNLQVVFPLNSDDDFARVIEESSKYLTVIDIHQSWCGPVSAMEPLYRKAFIELDAPDQRIKFYTMDAEKLSPQRRTALAVTDACKPLFVVYKVRAFFFLLVPIPPPLT